MKKVIFDYRVCKRTIGPKKRERLIDWAELINMKGPHEQETLLRVLMWIGILSRDPKVGWQILADKKMLNPRIMPNSGIPSDDARKPLFFARERDALSYASCIFPGMSQGLGPLPYRVVKV